MLIMKTNLPMLQDKLFVMRQGNALLVGVMSVKHCLAIVRALQQ